MKQSWFSEGKGDYSDVWTTKIMIKTNEIDMNVCFFQKNITHKNHVCPYSLAFFLLVYWFVNLAGRGGGHIVPPTGFFPAVQKRFLVDQ